ncbi:hypothetical protein GCM10011497_22130 [Elstera cyanobacteriorum]|nr:hypothetical protein GCM10011497_22130 [Elstera cyanobacteriorum]
MPQPPLFMEFLCGAARLRLEVSRGFAVSWFRWDIPSQEKNMLDFLFLAALGAGFSALVGYALACAKEIDR